MARFHFVSVAQLLVSVTGALAGLTVDVDDADSVKKAAALVAEDLMSFYTGEIPGVLPGPPPNGDYYFWTGGALWTSMLDYRNRTGDTQYDEKISEGLLWQRGPQDRFLSANWTASEGNDDQAIWAMASLLAAETGFTEPEDVNTTWAAMAQNVFDFQSNDNRRVTEGPCSGALRWQIYPINTGYNYIATSANVAYANLAARLSVQNGNDKTQATAVQDTFDFLETSKFIDSKFNVFNGAPVMSCDNIDKLQFSYLSALALESAAVMYNSTGGDEKWKTLVDGLTGRSIDVFFPDGVAKEVACEPDMCNTDMTFFKAFLHRSLASTMKAAPYTTSLILPVLKTSAAAAVKSCTAGDNKRMCVLDWTNGSDNQMGAGPQMSVLSALLSLLPAEKAVDSPSSGVGGNGTTNSTTPTGSSSEPSETPGSSGANARVSAVVLLGGMALASLWLV
ncbi:glycosyl hydrolase family 76-domain-containing protein [Xylaria sp. FL0933]|nr:glycosyl hydrolase family 76-domain-containing protein [Xylaria sp. FL0933]